MYRGLRQSALTVVRMAQSHAQEELTARGRIRPGVFMLVRRNPQTDAPLSQPIAIGTVNEEGFADESAQQTFFEDVRTEARRLEATAVAICLQAEAELTDSSAALPVALIHIEDNAGLSLLHAPIATHEPHPTLGAFVSMAGQEAMAASGIDPIIRS